MKKSHLVSSFAALAISTLFLTSVSSDAAVNAKKCRLAGMTIVECACENALNSGSQKALRLFLRQYPGSDTACNATASTKVKTPASGGGNANTSTSSSNSPAGGGGTVGVTVKQNHGLGNGNEGDCSGSGCSDSDNPGHN